MSEVTGELPSSRKEAKEKGVDRYFTGIPCKHGHIDQRSTRKARCLTCAKIETKKQYREHRDEKLDYARRYRENNQEKIRQLRKDNPQYSRNWKIKHPEQNAEINKKWRESNPNYYREYYLRNEEVLSERSRQWARDNKERKREVVLYRKAVKIQRTPLWVDRGEILLVYNEAERLSNETGVPHEVDHYYPLQGKTVSGLHVAENLCAIPSSENRMKWNKHPDDYYGFSSSS